MSSFWDSMRVRVTLSQGVHKDKGMEKVRTQKSITRFDNGVEVMVFHQDVNVGDMAEDVGVERGRVVVDSIL